MDKAAFHKGKSPFFGKGRCIRSQEPLPRPPMFADFHLRNGFRPLSKETFLEKILSQPLSVPFVTSTPF
ncbi:hypothetical protein, partial [Bilophila wadsworthia]|uniref:hypothetical protein n=1 Tax=Bilophila wadsworthia TaxID=35833 RepID=UPI003AB13C55